MDSTAAEGEERVPVSSTDAANAEHVTAEGNASAPPVVEEIQPDASDTGENASALPVAEETRPEVSDTGENASAVPVAETQPGTSDIGENASALPVTEETRPEVSDTGENASAVPVAEETQPGTSDTGENAPAVPVAEETQPDASDTIGSEAAALDGEVNASRAGSADVGAADAASERNVDDSARDANVASAGDDAVGAIAGDETTNVAVEGTSDIVASGRSERADDASGDNSVDTGAAPSEKADNASEARAPVSATSSRKMSDDVSAAEPTDAVAREIAGDPSDVETAGDAVAVDDSLNASTEHGATASREDNAPGASSVPQSGTDTPVSAEEASAVYLDGDDTSNASKVTESSAPENSDVTNEKSKTRAQGGEKAGASVSRPSPRPLASEEKRKRNDGGKEQRMGAPTKSSGSRAPPVPRIAAAKKGGGGPRKPSIISPRRLELARHHRHKFQHVSARVFDVDYSRHVPPKTERTAEEEYWKNLRNAPASQQQPEGRQAHSPVPFARQQLLTADALNARAELLLALDGYERILQSTTDSNESAVVETLLATLEEQLTAVECEALDKLNARCLRRRGDAAQVQGINERGHRAIEEVFAYFSRIPSPIVCSDQVPTKQEVFLAAERMSPSQFFEFYDVFELKLVVHRDEAEQQLSQFPGDLHFPQFLHVLVGLAEIGFSRLPYRAENEETPQDLRLLLSKLFRFMGLHDPQCAFRGKMPSRKRLRSTPRRRRPKDSHDGESRRSPASRRSPQRPDRVKPEVSADACRRGRYVDRGGESSTSQLVPPSSESEVDSIRPRRGLLSPIRRKEPEAKEEVAGTPDVDAPKEPKLRLLRRIVAQ